MENDRIRISVIVPVYKVESYLERCVRSLTEQTAEAGTFEILLIDDGSPDRCGELCEDYAQTYPMVKAFHKENGGLSSARNYGVDHASGEWIVFVDSDDYVDNHLCGRLMKEAEKHPELDVMAYNGIEETQGETAPVRSKVRPDIIVSGKDYLLYHEKTRSLGVEAWLYAYRRSFLQQENLRFQEGILHEDVEFTPRAMLRAKKVLELDENFYHYIVREESISTSKNMEKNIRDLFATLEAQCEEADRQSDPELRKWMKNAALDSCLNMVQTARMYEPRYCSLLKKRFLWGKAATPWNHFRVLLCTCSVRLYCWVNDTYKKRKG